MSQSTRMGELRALLYQRPSAEAWEALCTFFHYWPDAEDLELGLQYAEGHLAHWPDKLRVAPQCWITEVAEEREPPAAWRLVRSVCLQHHRETDVVVLAHSPHMSHITGLNLLSTLQDRSLRRCFHSPYLGQIQRLHLGRQSLMTWDTLGVLASTKLGKNVARLSLGNVVMAAPADTKSLRTDAFPCLERLQLHRCGLAQSLLERMKGNPHWPGQLTHLEVTSCSLNTRSMRALEDADFWQGVTHLNLSGNFIHRGGCNVLFGILQRHPITHLKLDRARMHTECFRGLRDLKYPTQLKHLSLRNNRIDDACLSLLSRLLVLDELEHLAIEGNRHTIRGIGKLVASPYLTHEARRFFLEALSDGTLKDLAQQRKLRYAKRISRFKLMDLLLQR